LLFEGQTEEDALAAFQRKYALEGADVERALLSSSRSRLRKSLTDPSTTKGIPIFLPADLRPACVLKDNGGPRRGRWHRVGVVSGG
jgi:hypothetical protein